MKRRLLALSVVVLWATAMVSLAAATEGGQAWVDDPLDGTLVTSAPVAIVAHATDPAGVTLVRLSVDGQVVTETAASGATLVTVEFSWTPPGDGLFLLEVSGSSQAGVWGQPGAIVLEVLLDAGPTTTTTAPSRTTTTLRQTTTTGRPTTTTSPPTTSSTTSTTYATTTSTTRPDPTTTSTTRPEPTTTTTERTTTTTGRSTTSTTVGR
ncbi:MAG TPA: Ig-like domain-containing protein [Acidimicrobiia bacterium]|jgi:hypothetical protein